MMRKTPTMDDLYSLGTKAGEVVRDIYFGGVNMDVEFKADATPVTVADRTIYQLVGNWRDSLFPDLAIVSEEGHKGERTGDSDQHWMLVDEIDGTWAYHLGIPVFSSLFALMKGSEVVASCIVDPISHRIYTAEHGKGAFLNQRRIRVKEPPKTPSVGIVAWPHRGVNDMLIHDMYGLATELHKAGMVVMKMGTIGYVDALVASGQLSATIFPGSTLHDTAAGDLLVREAGGVATALHGGPLQYGNDTVYGHVFSCSQEFHGKMMRVIGEHVPDIHTR